MKEHIIHPIPPFYDKDSTILILGSFPSVKSREQMFFYGHPQNRYWKVIASVFNDEVPVTIPAKKAFLKKHHIAMWDVIGSCDITGSSDSSIENVTANDLSVILCNSKVKTIFVNGKTAGKYYKKYTEQNTGIKAVCLPSTSPANAAWSLGRLEEVWSKEITGVNMKKILETERLFLREMSMDDFDAYYKVLADREIMQHYPYVFDEERVRSWIERNMNRYKNDGFGLWAVCLKETGEMIGDCGLTLQNIEGEMLPEIGYHIRRDMQRKGYAKEAAMAVRDWAFSNTSYPALYSYCKYTNEGSFKTAESIGMKFCKEYPDEANGITHVSVIRREDLA